MAFLGKILGNYADQSFENMVPSGTSATALPRKAYQWTLGIEVYPNEGASNSDDPKEEDDTSLWEDAKAWGEEALMGADPPDPNKFQDINSLLKRAVLVPQSVQLPQTTVDNTYQFYVEKTYSFLGRSDNFEISKLQSVKWLYFIK